MFDISYIFYFSEIASFSLSLNVLLGEKHQIEFYDLNKFCCFSLLEGEVLKNVEQMIHCPCSVEHFDMRSTQPLTEELGLK